MDKCRVTRLSFVGELLNDCGLLLFFSAVCRGNAKALFHFLLKSHGRGVEQLGPGSGRRNERRNEKRRGKKLKHNRLRNNSPKKRLQVNSKVRRVLKARLKMM